jgi:autotransporter-associated beta strand protein
MMTIYSASRSIRVRLAFKLALASAFPVLIAPSLGRAETWTPTTAGTRDWNDAANWGGVAFPNSTGGVANISADFTGDQIINLNEAVTLGSLTINDTGSGTDNTVTIQTGTAGSLTFASGATITNTASSALTNTISAPVSFLGDATIYTNSGTSNGVSTRLALSGGISGSGTLTVRGAISNNASSLLVLSGSNTGFTGNWVLTGTASFNSSYAQSGPGLSIASDLSLGEVPTVAANQITFSSSSTAQLLLAAGVTLNANRGISLGSGSNAYLNTAASGTAEIAGSISGDGRVSVLSGAANRVTVLSGNNTYTGSTSVLSGTLRAGSTAAFGTNSAVSLSATSAAALSLNNFSNTIGSLSGGGGGANVSLGSATLTTGGNNTDTTFSGVISGSGGKLTKNGTGVFTLAGVNTYTGATTVNNGTLSVTGSLASGSVVGVFSGATLRGTGTVGGATTLNNGATVAAGVDTATLGTLTFGGTLTSDSGATFSLKLNSTTGTTDLLAANGVTLNGATLSLTDLGGTALAEGTTFTLLNNTSANGIVGTFAGLSEAGTITVGLNTYVISYVGGTGNDVTLTTSSIPEPSTYTALLGGAALLAVSIVRRRR